MKENIFTKIGKKVEEIKKNQQRRVEKYWKLSAIERIDYDNKIKDIQSKEYPFFYLTRSLFSALIVVILLMASLNIIVGYVLPYSILNLWKLISFLFYSCFWLDIILFFLNDLERDKEKVNLNKRFKLI